MLQDNIIRFFQSQHFAIVSTIDKNGSPRNSCKGIVEITEDGRIYLLDLYMGKTYENLTKNPNINITAVDEHKFIGYSLKGRASIIKKDKISAHLMRLWENKITSRITHRVLKNIQGEKGHSKHPEALLPKPAYMILIEVEEVVDLIPHHIRQIE